MKGGFAGLVLGVDNLGRTIALSTLIFAGGLAAGAPLGNGIFLIAGILGVGSLMLRPFYIGPTFSNVQNTIVAILLPAVLAIGAADIGVEARLVNVLALLGLTAILTGIAMLGMGALNLGRFARLMPFPVSSGYLAASGALLGLSAVKMLCPDGGCTGASMDAASGRALLLALGFALILWLIILKWRNFGLVAGLALGFVGFYVGLWIIGMPIADARALGLLPELQDAAPVALSPRSVGLIDPSLIWQSAPFVLAAVVVSLFSAMLNVTGVELTLKIEADSRRELGRAGVLNILTGLFGSTVSFISASNTATSVMLGGHGRQTGLVAMVVLALGIPFSGAILAFVPPFISAGLLIFFGVSILNRWWFFTRHQQSRLEWFLALLIVIASLIMGMPLAVLLGLVLASMIFAVSYARLPVIRAASDLSVLRSTVDRGRKESKALGKHGGQVAVIRLQGYLFFGSVEQVALQVREVLESRPETHTLILDFSRVSRIDASSIAALEKLDILTSARGVSVVLADVNTTIAQEITRARLLGDTASLHIGPTTDEAMEAAEEEILSRLSKRDRTESLSDSLAAMIGDAKAAQQMMAVLERIQVPDGHRIVTQGEVSRDVYLLEEGRLSVYLNTEGGARIRVLKQRPGSIVGEIAAYTDAPRTADVIADGSAVVYRLSHAGLERLQDRDPALVGRWHQAMATTLAEKLDRTNRLLRQQGT